MPDHNDIYQNCNLCPNKCGINRSEDSRGICKATAKCVINHVQLHKWEEPPLTTNNEGVNVGSGTVFFGGCTLSCIYCQNWKISSVCNGKIYTISEIADIFIDLQNKGALNINIVTGTHYAPTIISAIKNARDRGLELPIVWNTSGYENTSTIDMLIPYVDTWLFDFKYYDDALAQDLSKARNYYKVAFNALTKIVARPKYNPKNIIVRHMILPDHITDSKNVLKLLNKNFVNKITYSIMSQYTPEICNRARFDKRIAKQLNNYPELKRSLTVEEYEEVLNYADYIGIEDYFWQEPGSDSESFIPEFKSP